MKNIIKRLIGSIAFKSLAGILIMLILFSAIATTIGYNGFTKSFNTQYEEEAFYTAAFAASVIDPDQLEVFKRTGSGTQEYQAVHERIAQICNATGATFIYVIQPDLSDYWHITFLISTMNSNSPYTEFEFGYYRETTNEDYRNKYRALYEEGSEKELVIRDQGYISTNPHITAMVPLKGTDGNTKAILCVQRQMDVLATARRDYVQSIIFSLLLMLLVAIAGQWIFLNRMLLYPVKMITEEASRFAAENIAGTKKLKDSIRSRDEIGVLAESIDRMEEQVEDYIENLTHVTAEKERISTELSLASRIQADMLPRIFPPFPNKTEFDLYAEMDPAKEVGGDFYDFFLIDDDHLCMVIADVSGKGVPAALFMMASKIVLKNNAMSEKSPAKILEIANKAICENNREEMFITVWIGILEISSGRLTAANAGHEYPALKRPDGRFELIKDQHGFVVGGMEGVKYRDYELKLEPGSRLFLYTDGVPEATSASEELFGTDRMLAALNRNPKASVSELLASVRNSVDAFTAQAEQFDDLTMMCLEYK